jgi:tRNA pseudouridine55 synthase
MANRQTEIDGVLVVDKPSGPTSHDVVVRVRRIVGGKVGHIGTLDPAATGVLPVVLGRATRLSQHLTASEKEYVARIRLGKETDTYDGEGTVTAESPVPAIEPADAERLLDSFRGPMSQVPPPFSAVKVGGEPLYRAARRGDIREVPARKIVVHELVLLERSPETWTLRVRCSAGTYIRRIAHEIGRELGCGAFLESLRRTRAGHFSLEQALSLERLEAELPTHVVPLDDLLPDLPETELEAEEAVRVRHGNAIPPRPGQERETRLIRLTYFGRLIALGEVRRGRLQPVLVLRPED